MGPTLCGKSLDGLPNAGSEHDYRLLACFACSLAETAEHSLSRGVACCSLLVPVLSPSIITWTECKSIFVLMRVLKLPSGHSDNPGSRRKKAKQRLLNLSSSGSKSHKS